MQTNRSTFGLMFYINTGKTKKSGKCPIMGRISIDGKSAAFSTGLAVLRQPHDGRDDEKRGTVEMTDRLTANYKIIKKIILTRANAHFNFLKISY